VLGDADVVWVVIVLIFVVVSFLSQLAGKWKEVQKEASRRARANLPQGQPKPGGSLDDEIAEFLRRAAERQKPAQADRPAAPPAPSPAVVDEAMRPFRAPPRGPIGRPSPAEPEVPVAVPVDESVAEHVRERFARPQFGQVGSAGLGKEVAQTDEVVDQRLRKKFGHGVSRLAGVPGEAAEAPAAVEPAATVDLPAAPAASDAATVAALLANPATLRHAILVSEILRRPEERWHR
jgi:hypothetical protein